MKNQFFGDNKDLFKYDLVQQITKAKSRLVDHFTFIPMLTEPGEKEHGRDTNRKKAKAGKKNKNLLCFLNQCVAEGRRNIKELESYLEKEHIKATIYGRDKYFCREESQEYFSQIQDKLLRKSLIFVDPDNGLEIDKSGKEHILYSEVKTLYDRMAKNSILMVFQYFPHENHPKYLSWRAKDLKDKIEGDLPLHIDNDKIIFFFLTKENGLLRESLGKVISKYGEAYDLRVEIT